MGRLGVPAKNLEEHLAPVLEITGRYGVQPTFAIATPPLHKQKHLLRLLKRRGAEIALLHRRGMPADVLKPALEMMRRWGISCHGFRSAELGDDDAPAVGAALDFEYGSNTAYLWPVLEPGMQSTLGPRHPASPFTSPVLPRQRGGLIELPVSLPDDTVEATPPDEQVAVLERRFASILERVRDRGECYVLRLTQQNLAQDGPALERLLSRARQGSPPVWIASLVEVTRWWQRKRQARVNVEKTAKGYRLTREFPAEARFLVNSAAAKAGVTTSVAFPDDWLLAESDTIELATNRSPILGVSRHSSEALRHFLAGEGVLFTETDQAEEHCLHLDWSEPVGSELEFKFLAHIQCASAPVVRMARWPHGFAAALAITIELDSLTLHDFIGRRREPTAR